VEFSPTDASDAKEGNGGGDGLTVVAPGPACLGAATLMGVSLMKTRRNLGSKDIKLSQASQKRLARLAADFRLVQMDIGKIKQPRQSLRRHPRQQIAWLAEAIARFGFLNPVVVDGQARLLAGHARLEAVRCLNLSSVPALVVTHLKVEDRRLFSLWDNRLAEMAAWDRPLLRQKLEAIEAIQISSGGTMPRLLARDLERLTQVVPWDRTIEADDRCPPIRPDTPAVTRRHEGWILGGHRLLCGDAAEVGDIRWVLDYMPADMVFTDPLVDRPIDFEGVVRDQYAPGCRNGWSAGLDAAKVSGSLAQCFSALGFQCRSGAIILVCTDWLFQQEVLAAAETGYLGRPQQMIVWVKPDADSGMFYRGRHELIYAFKSGPGPHYNNFDVPDLGRDRDNVWTYPGAARTFTMPDNEVVVYPTAKSVVMVADALVDCSPPGGRVLDPFGGSGTTLIAAERCGRKAGVIESDPLRCDVIIRRWQALTGKKAKLAGNGGTFEAIQIDRQSGG
jgi:DNA modification methylase